MDARAGLLYLAYLDGYIVSADQFSDLAARLLFLLAESSHLHDDAQVVLVFTPDNGDSPMEQAMGIFQGTYTSSSRLGRT